MVRLTTLGGLAIHDGDDRIRIPSRKSLALLIYLCAHQGKIFTRDQLAGLLWSSYPNSRARHSLSQCLYTLRQRLPSDYFDCTGEEIAIRSSTVDADFLRFADAAHEKRHSEAVAIYAGDFLAGVALGDSKEFDDWVDGKRVEYRYSALHCMRCLITSAEQGGDWEEVRRIAARLVELDPFDESVHRSRIRAIALTQGYREAAHECRRLFDFIAAELDRSPEDESTELADLIEAGALSNRTEAKTAMDPLRFVGRRHEFEEMCHEWNEACLGGPRALVVVGAAGIGKSRLVRHFLRWAALRDARILAGKCYPADTQVPYAGIADALVSSLKPVEVEGLPGALVRPLSAICPDLFGDRTEAILPKWTEEIRQQHVCEAVRKLIVQLSRRSPIALVIDDYHWADASTARVVSYLLRRLRHEPILVILALRSGETTAHSFDSSKSLPSTLPGLVKPMHLGELKEEDATKLLEAFEQSTRYEIPASLQPRIISQAGGNPFLLLELLKALRNGEIDQEQDNAITNSRSPHPVFLTKTIEQFLRTRIDSVSENATRILEALAVLGKDADPSTVSFVSGLDRHTLLRGIEEVRQKELIKDGGTYILFAHNLIRDAVYRSMMGVRRRILHGLAADALRTKPRVAPATLAIHYDLAGIEHSALEFSVLAAEESRKMCAYSEAEFFYRMALANAFDSQQRCELHERLAELLYDLRRFSEAREIVERLLPLYREEGRDDFALRSIAVSVKAIRGASSMTDVISELRALCETAWTRGDNAQLMHLLPRLIETAHTAGQREVVTDATQQLADLAGDMPATIDAVKAYAVIANSYTVYQSASEGLRYAERAMRTAQRIASNPSIVFALNARALSRMYAGKLSAAEADFEHALNIASSVGLKAGMKSVLLNSGVLYLERGDYQRAERALERARKLAIDAEANRELLLSLSNLLLLRYEVGARHDATVVVERIVQLTENVSTWWCTITAWSILGLYAIERGDFTEANRCRREIMLRLEGRELWVADASYVEMFLARLAAADGQPELALERLERAIAAYEGRDVFCRSRLQLERARVLREIDTEESRRQAEEVRRCGREIGARPLVVKAELILD